MHKLMLAIFLLATNISPAQKISGKLQFQTGQLITVSIHVKKIITQQAGARAIDFSVNGSAIHQFKVLEAKNNTFFLEYALKNLKFEFEGMGQKESFDSDSKNDMEGPYGMQCKEMLATNYKVTIDHYGKILATVPEKLEGKSPVADIMIITGILKDLSSITYSVKKGMPGFFMVLPEHEIAVSESWNSLQPGIDSGSTINTLTAINDSTIIINYKTTASSIINSETSGSQARTSMNDTKTGKIILDRNSGIIREETSSTESKGNTEAMGGKVAVTGKTDVEIVVK